MLPSSIEPKGATSHGALIFSVDYVGMAFATSREPAASFGSSRTAAALGESLCCGICYELLLDPVVGSCGHDFCKRCLDTWRSQQRQQGNNRVRCPVCRGSFAESFDKLGVCVRLRDMVELLFPERIAARRTELEQQAALQKKRSVEQLQQVGTSVGSDNAAQCGVFLAAHAALQQFYHGCHQQSTAPSQHAVYVLSACLDESMLWLACRTGHLQGCVSATLKTVL
eukprot:GHRQ01011016.1.p1 GENE.GHRQ01011016.1~~GHRQ01011016.1.p1  ORF type:complete len:226 (+),score=38.18 GHRQ01011016.1:2161-2838(+)